ncbi:ATP-binding cassette domain-containing protein [Geotalea uraniireducens]|uniref:ABC-type transport system involved in resistance to organic solvents ATPase component-like protein n=1 Tax=Geotalea uraniireducens (strain Rf4) TaxID=351605 RepID=A5GF80_GEOUR|nr:ATP-binding cassette domain-containing protein [Geotalea uraniireducens]ABQ26085.1 ABC-type transport system involved in resistance to organic solvents ATPase component-like protein [Geotalea uraniireducens Rf4]
MMTEIIKAESLSFDTLLEETSFTVESGSTSIVVTAKEEVDACLVRLLLGFIRPASGRLFLFDTDISTFTDRELSAVRQRIGLIYASGGLVSNLKVWENVVLPLAYSNKFSREQIEQMGLAVLNRLGYSGKLMALPGHIPLFQKRLAGLARTMLMDPDLVIYESPLTGLNYNERNQFLRIAREFHLEKPGRTSLFLSSTPEIVPLLEDARVITFTQRQSS